MSLKSAVDLPESEVLTAHPTVPRDFLKAPSSSNLTSLLKTVSLKEGMYMQKAFEVSLYPTKIPFFAVGSSFVLFSEGTYEYVRHPKILKCPTSCFYPEKVSSGVILPTVLCGLLFCR
jgi:hypothetical protein